MFLTVIGGGIVGLWTAAEAARRGFKVELFEQFVIGHDRGSSHGDTRIFRTAYWEGEEYVNLARKSIPMWEWLHSKSPTPVFNMTGGFYIGATNSPLITGLRASANIYSLPVSEIKSENILPKKVSNGTCLEEELAGIIYADAALNALKNFCLEKGVKIRENTNFFDQQNDGVHVYCLGPWFYKFPKFSNLLTSSRVYCHWFSHDGKVPLFKKSFLIQGKDGRILYGMPTERYVVKVGWHNYPIIPLSPGVAESASPGQYIDDIKNALSRITSKKLKHLKSKGCYFTNSLDENYIISKIGNNNWAIAGLSGHGFKFAPALSAGVLDGVENGMLNQKFDKFSSERFDMKNIISRTHVSESDLSIGNSWEI